MRAALHEARLWLGATSPNPAVGAAALDADGQILAVAAHRRAGTDHAEAALLKKCHDLGLAGRIHTVCVTLEPCNHHGRTPPCSEALIAAGVQRVVIGITDPNPQVKGGGAARLRQAGIEVIEQVESEACQQLIHSFLFHARTGHPFVTIKQAFDEKGSMIPPVGHTTFTSPTSLKLAHQLRKKADAILTGSGTILADHPAFTVRHVPDFSDKQRVLAILDRRKRVPDTYFEAARARNLLPLRYDSLDFCLSDLESRGIRDVLVESGPNLSRSLLESAHVALSVTIHKGTEDHVTATLSPWAQKHLGFNKLSLELATPL